MAPIRGQKKKKEENVDLYAHLPPRQFPIQPSSDGWDTFSKRFSDGLSNFVFTKSFTSGSLHGQNNLAEFGSFFKISMKTFDYICGLVEDEMVNRSDLRGQHLSLKDRVAIALRRLRFGEPMAIIGELTGVHQSAVWDITWSFVQAMEKKGSHHLHWPSTKEETSRIKSKFERIRGIPNCCGAIDTRNVVFSLSSDDPSSKIWCNEDNHPSTMLQAIVDPDMRFLDVYIGLPGCLSDSKVLHDSGFFRLSEEGKRLNGKKHVLAKEVKLREYIVGDGELPLLPWLLTPYQGGGVRSVIQEDFNKRHYQTWKVANQALTRLIETWKIIQGVVWRPDNDKLVRFVYVCCLLHNIMIDQNEAMQDDISLPSHYSPESLQKKGELPDKNASIQRDKLAVYLASIFPPF